MRARQRCDGDGGVAVVEFALVLPVLAMLLLGMVSGAIAWNENLALSQGARVAAREAVTRPLPATLTGTTMDPWLDDVADRAVAASEGKMAAGVNGRVVCVAYVYPAGTAPDETFSRTMDANGTRVSGTSPCFVDGQGDSDRRVQVTLQRVGVLDVGFWRQELTLRRQVVYRFEAHSGL